MQKSTKPIRVAGDSEFGEKYHVAVALLRDPELVAIVFGVDSLHAAPFLNLFAKGRVEGADRSGIQLKECRDARDSTSIYCREKWSPERARRWWETIRTAAFPKHQELRTFLNGRLPQAKDRAALVWIRNKDDFVSAAEATKPEPKRNSTQRSVSQLISAVRSKSLRPILIGDTLENYRPESGNLIEFHANDIFKCDDSICLQLLMFDLLIHEYGVCASIGMKSGGMDGPGLFLGLPTVSFARCSESRRVRQIANTIRNFRVILFNTEKDFAQHSSVELGELHNWLQDITES